MTKPTGKGRGRPPGPPVDLLTVRIPVSLMRPLAGWADANGVSRQEAIRSLVADGLGNPAGARDEAGSDPSLQGDVLDVASGGPPSVLNMLQGTERTLVLAPVVRALLASGVKGLRDLQKALNASGMTAPKGGVWHPKTVARLLEDLGYSADGQAIGITPSEMCDE